MTGHNIVHYMLACVAIGMAAASLKVAHDAKQQQRVVITSAQPADVKGSRTAWASLGQARTIQIGEALQKSGLRPAVMIYCDNSDCDALAHDLDDAMQIASWPSDLERAHVDAQSDRGLFVGPCRSLATDALMAALAELKPQCAEMSTFGIIIGKKP